MPLKLVLIGCLLVVMLGIAARQFQLVPAVWGAELFSDTFERTVSGGWGTSTSGHSYALSNGTDYNVSGGSAQIITAKGVTRGAYPNSVSAQDAEILFKFKTNQLPSGANQQLNIITRNIGSSNYYRSKIFLGTDSIIYVNFSYVESGTEHDISSNTAITGISVEANTYYRVKAQVQGTTPTTLRIKVWKDGSSEPVSWAKTVTNAQTNLQTSGSFGFQTYVGSGSSVTPVTMSFDEYSIGSVPTPTPTPTPYPNAQDTFTRTTLNGWGDATTGGTYTNAGGSLTSYGVNGSAATIAVASGNTSNRSYLSSVSMLNSDQKIKVKTSKIAAGSTMYTYLLSRTDTNNSNEYFLQVLFRTSQKVAMRLCKLVSGVENCLTTEYSIPYLTHAPDEYIWLRLQTSGSNPTTLKAKVWKDGWKEPLDWQASTTDSETALQTAAAVGVRSFISSSASNLPITFTFDDYTASATLSAGIATTVTGTTQDKGVTWHNGSWYDTTITPNKHDWQGLYRELSLLKAAGVSWVRIQMDSGTQTSCSETGYYSYLRNALDTFDMHALITIKIPNNLTTTATTDERAAFRSWLTTMVTCYKNNFQYWEIGNEPNLSQFWHINDDPASDQTAYEQSVTWYYTYLQDAYDVIKGIDASATVIHAGLSQYKLDRWLAAAASIADPSSFDAVAFHPYSDYASEGSINQLNIFYDWLQRTAGMASKPIWITEVGYTANGSNYPGNTGGSEAVKASSLTSTFTDLKNWGITTPIFWYDASQLKANPTEGYELLYFDRNTHAVTERTAYTALSELWPDHITTDVSTEPTNIQILAGSSRAHFSWQTDKIASGYIQYGLRSVTERQSAVVNNSPAALSHTVTLDDLQACQKYYFQVVATDAEGTTQSSSVSQFTTPGCVVTIPPVISTPQCQDHPPAATPKITQATQTGKTAKIFIEPVVGATNYAVAFGTSTQSYKYSLFFNESQSSGLIPVSISDLDAQTEYYFVARAGTGCAPGEWSSPMKASKESAQTVQAATAKKHDAAIQPTQFSLSKLQQNLKQESESAHLNIPTAASDGVEQDTKNTEQKDSWGQVVSAWFGAVVSQFKAWEAAVLNLWQ